MKILVIDDELVSRKKMEKIMKIYGDCQTAHTGVGAVKAVTDAIINNEPFELITLDIELPDIDGISVLKQIREMEKRGRIPYKNLSKVIMVTSHANKDVIVESMKAGCSGYVVKPFTRETIFEKMESIGVKQK